MLPKNIRYVMKMRVMILNGEVSWFARNLNIRNLNNTRVNPNRMLTNGAQPTNQREKIKRRDKSIKKDIRIECFRCGEIVTLPPNVTKRKEV